MKIFIWERVDDTPLTRSYHDQGGLLVVAKDYIRAVQMIEENQTAEMWGEINKEFNPILFKPNLIYNISDEDAEEKLIVFPDAGCC